MICGTNRTTSANSIYPKGRVSFFEDISVISKTQVLQMKFNDKNPALRKSSKHSVKLINIKL